METIFDHNITKEEVDKIIGFPLTKEEYMSICGSQEECYTDIYYLYLLRNNVSKGKYYLDKIPNSVHKAFSISMFDIDIFSKG